MFIPDEDRPGGEGPHDKRGFLFVYTGQDPNHGHRFRLAVAEDFESGEFSETRLPSRYGETLFYLYRNNILLQDEFGFTMPARGLIVGTIFEYADSQLVYPCGKIPIFRKTTKAPLIVPPPREIGLGAPSL